MKHLLFGCMIVGMISVGCNHLPGGAAGRFPKFRAGSWRSNPDLWEITPASGDDRTSGGQTVVTTMNRRGVST